MKRITKSSWLRPVSLSVSIIIIQGCATAPKPKNSVEVAGEKISIAEASEKAPRASLDWLASFSDPPLTTMVDRALTENLGLVAAEHRLKAAEASTRISRSLSRPTLSLGLNSNKQRSRLSFLNFQKIESETHSLSLGSQWEIDLWGRLSDSTSSSIAEYDASLADFEAFRLSLAGQVAKTWFNAITTKQQWKLADESAKNFEAQSKIIQKRYDRGLSTGLELRLTQAQAASSQSLATQRKSESDNASRALEILLSRFPSNSIEISETLAELPEAAIASVDSRKLGARPDLIAEERRLASLLSRESASSKNWLPRLVLSGSYGTSSDNISDILDTSLSVWSIAGDLTAAIFASGRLAAERDQAEALAAAQLAQLKEKMLNAILEVERSLAAEADLANLESQTKQASIETDAAAELAWSQYERGLIDLVSVLDTQRRAYDTRSQLLSIQNQRLQNRVNLHLAVGGSL